MLNSAIWAISVGDGGAPPVHTRTGAARTRAAGSLASMMRTVGAALKCVTPSRSRRSQTSAGSIRGIAMLRQPAAAIDQVWLQPSQWNIGSVQSTVEDAV